MRWSEMCNYRSKYFTNVSCTYCTQYRVRAKKIKRKFHGIIRKEFETKLETYLDLESIIYEIKMVFSDYTFQAGKVVGIGGCQSRSV